MILSPIPSNCDDSLIAVSDSNNDPENPIEDKVEVSTEEWVANITVSKTGKLANGTNAQNAIIEYGETITYTLSATNSGTATGEQKLQDADLENLLNGYTKDGTSVPATVKNVTGIVVK